MSISDRLESEIEAAVAQAAAPPALPVAPAVAAPGAEPELASRLVYVAPGALQPASPGGPGGPGEPTDFRGGQPPREGRRPPGVPQFRSSYLDYLPGVYQDNEFLARYLLIFEHILGPIARTVDNVPYVFDADITPRELLPWLGGWLGLVMDERWPEARRRELVRSAAELFRWRGTRRGMREFIRLFTGYEVEIVEPTLSQMGARRDLGHRFIVRLSVGRDEEVDLALLRRIIDAQKPATAAATVEIRRV